MSKIKVRFFTLLRLAVKRNEIEIDMKEGNIGDVLHKVQETIETAFLHLIIDRKGEILPGTIILLNGENVWFKEKLGTAVKAPDVIDLFTAAGGG